MRHTVNRSANWEADREKTEWRQTMADLKCIVDCCTYNENRLCGKGKILVGGKDACCCDETSCKSFVQRGEGQDAFKNSACQAGSTISIDCEAAKCVYNSDYKCAAGHVDIKGCSACDCQQTACATFREK